jgi:hypothetical protein
VPESWITDEMRGLVGHELGKQVSFPISASDIRKWAQAVYYPEPPPAYFWDAQAAEERFGGFVAPEEFNPFAWMSSGGPPGAGKDGSDLGTHPEARLGVAPPATRGLLNGGMTVEYTGIRMREGDVIIAVTTLDGYAEREGRLGLMLFTNSKQTWSTSKGDVIKVQRGTLIRY